MDQRAAGDARGQLECDDVEHATLTLTLSPFGGEGIEVTPSLHEEERA
jgi:hypothetical protein